MQKLKILLIVFASVAFTVGSFFLYNTTAEKIRRLEAAQKKAEAVYSYLTVGVAKNEKGQSVNRADLIDAVLKQAIEDSKKK